MNVETPTAPPVRRHLVPRLLRDRPFRRFWTAETVSLVGDEISAIALPLVAVLALGAGSAQMGYLYAATLVPNLLFSMLAGAWVDRYPHKGRIMIVTDLGRAALLLVVPIAFLFGLGSLPLLYVVAFGTGTLAVLFSVSYNTLYVSLVPPKDFIEASSLLNGSRAMAFVAGPSVGGVLVQVITAPLALLADAVSYVVSALFLSRIRPEEPPPAEGKGLGLGEGLRYIVRNPVLRLTLLGATTLNLFNYMFAALFVLYVTTRLGLSPAVLGVVIGAGAAGALIGAAVTTRVNRRLGVGRTLVLSFLLFPGPLLLVPAAGGPMPVVLGMLFLAEFFCGMGLMMLDITLGSVQVAAVADPQRARVAGAQRTINYGIRPVGALIGGFLGEALGVQTTLWVATIGALAGTLWVLPRVVSGLKDMPEPMAAE
jgi:predicted MFS family arabinose efflux permease